MNKNTIFWLLALAPFVSYSQSVKTNLYDKFLKKQRVETDALSLSGLTGKSKLSLGFTALGSTLYLNISGTGWGTKTIDIGDELSLLFSNDSLVSLKSTSLQGFEPGMVQNSYRHQYHISYKQLEALSRYDLVSIRKYSFKTFTDLIVPAGNAGRLKKLSALFVGELKKANVFKSLQQIKIKDIRNYLGDSVEFCSRVYRTRYFEESADGPTLLDVQANFSDPFVNVVILQKDREVFNGAPEKKYLNKEVCISGVPTLRNNIPYLVIHDREQIKVKSPVALEEIDLFVGDSITVTGTVFTARYLEDTKTKPTLLNVGAPYPDQPLTLVIENEERKNFTRPEEVYMNKTIRVAGKVVSFKGKPQIVLHTPEQVQIIADAEPLPAIASFQKDTVATAKVIEQPKVQLVEEKTVITNIEPEVKEVPAKTYAQFPGGDSAFALFIRKHLDLPESYAKTEQKQVVISFDLNAKGIWRNLRLVTSAGKELDKKLIRVLRKMPKWKPATQNGMAVATQVVYPVLLNDISIKE